MKYFDITCEQDEEMLDVEYEFLTPREVMNLLCIGKSTFYRLVHSGELPAFRIGKLWRVKRSDLKRFANH
ncbi:helix-turn-helix domain-containing protein [Butyricicoccus pullicaecorum]|uniref:Excisionase family DNA binding domain-containing protein n=1 Tax=Butyricicoccus pullicaecorum 1.2 TaxID=1203606 RepID=R8W177_9FIRM|nr:helix-turn-helix domain-containing protein [Butyricicoccus pullicaecorum]EOQ38715.1 excisionase family DNA binding domain-containing protein [Butyricicoccus pullicaecorum 1.2]SKA52644.1 transcriptional regulator, AlpA family [Butyricicoccus pullicaecorum DSM 23266]